MKVLVIDWNSYGDIKPAYRRRGTEIKSVTIDTHAKGEAQAAQAVEVESAVKEYAPDYVFSYNYFPFVSDICQKNGVLYASWIYDSPFMDLYAYNVPNPVNRIFVFDYGVYREFEDAGINTVFYLPLGVETGDGEAPSGSITALNPDLSPAVPGKKENRADRFISDITFVGSLYTEPKHRLYDKFGAMPEYTKGYLDGLIMAQKSIYGANIIESYLTDDIIDEMEKCYPTDPHPTSAMTPGQIYTQFVLERQVTSLERTEILTMLGERFGQAAGGSRGRGESAGTGESYYLNLYTHDTTLRIPGWKNCGPVDYYREMPAVFAASRINLNMTLRSIRTGMPLRALDIMAAGGLLMSNYQAEFTEYFVPGEDLVMYEDHEDMADKIGYYLSHEEERAKIAENGCRKVRTEHSVDVRLDVIEKTLGF